MEKYHVTIMSIDPDDNSEDPHQKYGLTVLANNEEDAKVKGKNEFERQYRGLPIFWLKIFKK